MPSRSHPTGNFIQVGQVLIRWRFEQHFRFLRAPWGVWTRPGLEPHKLLLLTEARRKKSPPTNTQRRVERRVSRDDAKREMSRVFTFQPALSPRIVNVFSAIRSHVLPCKNELARYISPPFVPSVLMTLQSSTESLGDVPILLSQPKSENYVLRKSSKNQFRTRLPTQCLVTDVH